MSIRMSGMRNCLGGSFGPLIALVAAVALAGCRQAPSEPQFPAAHRDVAPIVADSFSTEDARDRVGEAEEVMRLAGVKPGMWVADIGAYAAGRTFGRHKLAPTISPGKTWEGVAGGMAAVLALAALWVHLIDSRWPVDSASLYTRLVERFGWFGLVPLALLLAAFSVVGDLFESLVKRAAGAKDSSRLLPGHGGVLDRIDALLPVLPIAMAMATL